MNSKIFSVLLVLISSFLTSCSTTKKIQTLKPEADLAAPLIYEKETSFLSFPVSIKLKDIEQQTNNFLQGLIYEDPILEDDNIQLKVWKSAPIRLVDENGKIKTILPLKIWSKVRYGKSMMGYDLYDTRELYFKGVVTLIGEATFNNWQLQAKTEFKSVVWEESPSINIAGRSLPITYIVDPALKYFKADIEKKIDESIIKAMNFQSNVLDVLDKISTPILVNKTYDTWFRINPISLNSTEAKLKNETIFMDLEIVCEMESFIGKQATKKFRKDQIKLNRINKAKDQFNASLIIVSPYLQASKIITKNFEGQEFTSGSKKVIIKNVDLWHKNGKMIIALGMEGSINGTIYLAGIPKYNDLNETIYFDDLEYVLQTKSTLLKTANWLVHGLILNKIKSFTTYSIKADLDQAKLQIAIFLDKYSPTPGVELSGSMGAITIDKIQLTDQAVVATIKTQGKVKVKVEGLK
ncbi:DUF4403 family protein [Lutibacter sp.]|uniref:DUF4403 family protein n=1 Tax=Lutibacter sp. TaxID=1925666 RepID=UPI002736ECB3|nr:DUF4403 family protein [Lutibacter sp.]MDP3312150.1 DUF4403 family protein [Lutibacter sp.]